MEYGYDVAVNISELKAHIFDYYCAELENATKDEAHKIAHDLLVAKGVIELIEKL